TPSRPERESDAASTQLLKSLASHARSKLAIAFTGSLGSLVPERRRPPRKRQAGAEPFSQLASSPFKPLARSSSVPVKSSDESSAHASSCFPLQARTNNAFARTGSAAIPLP